MPFPFDLPFLTVVFNFDAVLVRLNSQHHCTIYLDFMCSSCQREFISHFILIFCSFFFYFLIFLGLMTCLLMISYVLNCRVLKHIEASRKEIDNELKGLVKLCRWDPAKSYLSIENLKKTRQKLKKLIQKYTVGSKL